MVDMSSALDFPPAELCSHGAGRQLDWTWIGEVQDNDSGTEEERPSEGHAIYTC